MEMKKLVEMSQKYGKNPDFVLAGGGNTSYKTDELLFVKGSGSSLATICPEQFVKLCRKSLNEVMTKTYSADEAAREAEVLGDMMDARCKGEEAKRPSVECLLHNLFPQKYVLHVHPAAVNGITCCLKGAEVVAEMFPDAIWTDATKPGYILADLCNKRMAEYKAEKGKDCQVLFLENHGIFFAADTTEEIDTIVGSVMDAINGKLVRTYDFSDAEYDVDKAAYLAPAARMLFNAEGKSVCKFVCNKELAGFLKDEKSFEPLAKSFTPDHIVYCKKAPLWIPYCETKEETLELLKKLHKEYVDANGIIPKVIAVEKLGCFVCGGSYKDASTAAEVFLDGVKIAVFAQSFGGAAPLNDELSLFIQNWEVESYRSKVSLSAGSAKRLTNKIAIITGAGQGFGKGIAECMAADGAYTVIADMNINSAQEVADGLCEKYGKGTAIAVMVNVSDEDAVKAMVDQTVLNYGGLDILVNNAGIARAGSLEEMTKPTFELVTAVNYTAFFLCTKYCTRPMKIQNAVCPDYAADIISINSKSGLAGSNKNFAYAGSKFGGIGLTQSFALELAPYNIKVNAICPGNFLDGPLWSDPEKGLFVQYLNAGKVPGAKNVEDVRKFYMSKVPLGRGCLPEDVAKAVVYAVEQKYETGQAIPVTGGQEMLK
ncbi:MAG: SDR family NAD(P)-dependent oxidoreductase [Ruminococcaceae bacterium]|nr:SDR family NAD(P)-dependent oxidoreductase [Oscillospiraceae bacterium]